MGVLLHLPTPAAPIANHTDEVWRGCWACGLVLFDDEPDLCTECDQALNTPPAPSDRRPLAWYMRAVPVGPVCEAIIETGCELAEAAAASWAIDHELDDRQRATYIGDVRGRAREELYARCFADAEAFGERRRHALDAEWKACLASADAMGRLLARRWTP